MRLLSDPHVRGIRRQHPRRNLQTLSTEFLDRDRAVSAFGFADHFKAEAVEWVEWIENTNVLGFCAQGIVRVFTTTLTCIASSPVAESRPMARAGSPVGRISFCPYVSCRFCSAACF